MAASGDKHITIDEIEPWAAGSQNDTGDGSNKSPGDIDNGNNQDSPADVVLYEPGTEKNYHRGIGPPVRKNKSKVHPRTKGRRPFIDSKLSQISSVYSSKVPGLPLRGNKKKSDPPRDRHRADMPRKREYKFLRDEDDASGTDDSFPMKDMKKVPSDHELQRQFSSADNIHNEDCKEDTVSDVSSGHRSSDGQKPRHSSYSNFSDEREKPKRDSDKDSVEFLSENDDIKIHYDSGKHKTGPQKSNDEATRHDGDPENRRSNSVNNFKLNSSETSLPKVKENTDNEVVKTNVDTPPSNKDRDYKAALNGTDNETDQGKGEADETGTSRDEAKTSDDSKFFDESVSRTSLREDIGSEKSQPLVIDDSLSMLGGKESTPLSTGRSDHIDSSIKASPEQSVNQTKDDSEVTNRGNEHIESLQNNDSKGSNQQRGVMDSENDQPNTDENMLIIQSKEPDEVVKTITTDDKENENTTAKGGEEITSAETIETLLASSSENNDAHRKEEEDNSSDKKPATEILVTSDKDLANNDSNNDEVQSGRSVSGELRDDESKISLKDKTRSTEDVNSEGGSSKREANRKTTVESQGAGSVKTMSKKSSDDSLVSHTSDASSVVRERKQSALRRINKRPESDKSKKSVAETPRHSKPDKTTNKQTNNKYQRKIITVTEKNKSSKTTDNKKSEQIKEEQKIKKNAKGDKNKINNNNNSSNKKANGFLPTTKRDKPQDTKQAEPQKLPQTTQNNKESPADDLKIKRTETTIEITEIENEPVDGSNNEAGSDKPKSKISKGILDKLKKGGGLVQPTNHDRKPLLNGSIKKGMGLTVPSDNVTDADKSSPRPSIDLGSRKSVDYRNQNMAAVVQVDDNEEKPKSVVANKNDEWIRSAIPHLPLSVSILCLIFNIFLPGVGTVISGFSVLCCGKTRMGSKDDTVVQAVCVNVWVGAAQMFTVTFLLVGWFWSIAWGVKMILLSVEYRKEQKEKRQRELQSLALSAFGNNLNMGRLLPV